MKIDIEATREKYLEILYSKYLDHVINKRGIDASRHCTLKIPFASLLEEPEKQMSTRYASYTYQRIFSKDLLKKVQDFRLLKNTCIQVTCRIYNTDTFESMSVYSWHSDRPRVWQERSRAKYPYENVPKDTYPAFFMFCTKEGDYVTFITFFGKK